jgi:hypothetical protein
MLHCVLSDGLSSSIQYPVSMQKNYIFNLKRRSDKNGRTLHQKQRLLCMNQKLLERFPERRINATFVQLPLRPQLAKLDRFRQKRS